MSATTAPSQARGSAGSRLPAKKLLVAFAVGFAVILLLSAIGATLLQKHHAAPPDCAPSGRCRPITGPRLKTLDELSNADLGYAFEYDPQFWSTEPDGPGFKLSNSHGFSFWVGAARMSAASQDALFLKRVSELTDIYPFLAPDDNEHHSVFGGNIGFRDARVGTFAGAGQGPSNPVRAVVLSATDGRITIVVSVVSDDVDFTAADGSKTSLVAAAYAVADSVLNTFRWPGDSA